MDPTLSESGRETLVQFRRKQLLEKPRKTRSQLLPKLKKVKGAIERLNDAIKKLSDCPLMPDVWQMQFTHEGRSIFRGGQLVVPRGMTESLWIKILQGDSDPLKTELGNLQELLERASVSVECAIDRKGRPGIARNQDRYSFFLKCLEILIKETGAIPSARVLGNLAAEVTGAVLADSPDIHGEQNGNWSRDAQDFLSELRKEANANGYGESTSNSL